jgi:hypothetical protein
MHIRVIQNWKKVFCHSKTGFATSINTAAEFDISFSGEFNYFYRCEVKNN